MIFISKMRNKKYKPIQVPAETHAIIKSYCDEYGFKIGGFIRMIVEKELLGWKPNDGNNKKRLLVETKS